MACLLVLHDYELKIWLPYFFKHHTINNSTFGFLNRFCDLNFVMLFF